jgi:NNP family nitrate/nitrite transporter-like MFS transporter
VAAIYFTDSFGLGLHAAGLAAAAFGMMNPFASMMGGVVADRFGNRWGRRGRIIWLFIVLFLEGLSLMMFSQARSLAN